jgi:hypothetical protein
VISEDGTFWTEDNMSNHYADYKWKNGIPYGVAPCEPTEAAISYKVVSDPYYKRISIECYEKGFFSRIIYDSALFDFRQLRANQQTAWEKKSVSPHVSHIHNQDDRLVFIEEYIFADKFCRRCDIRSPHGVPLATQQMFYTTLKDPFDGVILFDINNHAVIKKSYELDKETGEFDELQSESWDV